jgi:hypothetical protein
VQAAARATIAALKTILITGSGLYGVLKGILA